MQAVSIRTKLVFYTALQIMDPHLWIARCTARLHRQWPRLPDDQLREVAEELRREVEREANDPEHAAVEWLRRGMPDAK